MNTVPWLRSGTGKTPAEGGCILQVVDWIATGGWTDKPECVHPVLRELAIYVNDKATDEERQQLLDLVPRLMGTNVGDVRLTRQLLGWLARQVYPLYETWAGDDPERMKHAANVLACIEAAERMKHAANVLACIEAAERGEAAWAAGAAWAARAAWAAEAAWAARAAWAAGAAGAAEAIPDVTPMTLLTGLLDHFDTLTGRTQHEAITEEQWAGVCEVMST